VGSSIETDHVDKARCFDLANVMARDHWFYPKMGLEAISLCKDIYWRKEDEQDQEIKTKQS
jgi:hypothetical protein